MMKKSFFLLFFTLTHPSLTFSTRAFPKVPLEETNIEEDEFLREILDLEISSPSFLQPSNTRQCQYDDSEIMILLNKVNAPEALQDDLYKRTNPPNTRDLHSLPSLQPYFERSCNWGISGQFFANMTYKMYFTHCSPFIDSYLTLGNGEFLEKLDNQYFPKVNIPDTLPLFSPIKLQERRVGALLSAFKRYKGWSFMAVLPVYYLEHNFFLTEEEIDAISTNSVFLVAPSATDDNATQQMIACHLVNDAVGIGDLRLTLDYNLSTFLKVWALVGTDFIVPTAKAIKKGILGNCFPKNAPIPLFSFRELFCGENTDIINESLDLLVGAVDRLTTNVADSSLGEHCFSLRPFIKYTKPFTNRLNLVSYGQVQYFFPHKDTRFFIVKTNPQAFERDWEDPDPDGAAANLDFLNQALIDTLYTYPVCVKIKPGLVVHFNVSLQWEGKNFSAALGYDFWHKDKEKFLALPSSGATQKYAISKGLRSSAHQHKFFAHVFAHHAHQGLDSWHVGLRADVTFVSKGIGRDYTLALDFIYDF